MQKDMQQTEVRETNSKPGTTRASHKAVILKNSASPATILQRIVWFIVGLITTLILLRFALLLLGANQGVAFTDFIYGTSGVFLSPFIGIFGEPSYGQFVFEISSILAVAVYLLIGWGISKLLTLREPEDTI